MFKGRDVLSILDFSSSDLERLFRKASAIRPGNALKGKILATAFFEPSTRTRLSFETAILRLGGSVIGVGGEEATSLAKGENLADTVRMLDAYADVIVIRHPLEGAAKLAAEVAEVPVINGGDGKQHHPTQAMVDLYTIRKEVGRIEGLRVAAAGDLRYGRAATSFLYGICKFGVEKLFLVSPPPLKPREEVLEFLKASGVEYELTSDLEKVMGEVEVLYITRIQKERFPDPSEFERVKGSYRLTPELVERMKEGAIVLHPLPKVDEIDLKVDESRHARYFQQAAYAVPVRMALLSLLLGGR
ncbi:MAG: aspartate carbamoyltransferase [Candidatus Hadarchaeales archaeon]